MQATHAVLKAAMSYHDKKYMLETESNTACDLCIDISAICFSSLKKHVSTSASLAKLKEYHARKQYVLLHCVLTHKTYYKRHATCQLCLNSTYESSCVLLQLLAPVYPN